MAGATMPNNTIHVTNIPHWEPIEFDRLAELHPTLKIKQINDLEALAFGIPSIDPDKDCVRLNDAPRA